MIKSVLYVLTILFFISTIAACDRVEKILFGEKQYSYKDCLKNSFNGAHNYSADETKKLCEEIANVINPIYKWEDGELIPSNNFTKCYDKKMKKLSEQEITDPEEIEFAKLECKYGPESD